MKTLRDFFIQYTQENDLAASTVQSYANALSVFEEYNGGPIKFKDLEKVEDRKTGRQAGDSMLNAWITEYAKTVSPYTVKSRRAAILAMLADAFDLRVTTYRKMRVKTPRCHDTEKDVWSPDEVSALVKSSGELRGRFQKTQIKRNLYAQSLIMAAWDTGLRRADLLKIRWDWIKDSHVFEIVCNKTGKNHITKVAPETRKKIMLTFDSWTGDYRELCWPIWYNIPGRQADRAVSDLFKVPLRKSGLRCSDGVFKKLRRSSATYTKLNGGNATDHLGHSSEAITRKHYINEATIRRDNIVLPPSLTTG